MVIVDFAGRIVTFGNGEVPQPPKLHLGIRNNCGRFTPITYKFYDDQTSCTAHTVIRETGQEITGPAVSVQMAIEEGWGDKWRTMPELMLRYRAAAFMIRTTAPELALGIYTQEELEDIDAQSTQTRN